MENLIEDWQPKAEAKFEAILLKAPEEAKEVLGRIRTEILRPDFEVWLRGLAPEPSRFGTVVTHADSQENNVLAMNGSITDLLLIDFEYLQFGHISWDIANTIQEMVIDNNHPKWPHVRAYTDNFPRESEIRERCEDYLKIHKESDDSEWSLEEEVPILQKAVYRSMVLQNIDGILWALL